MTNCVFYVADVETTGLDSRLNDVIELSLYRLGSGGPEESQKTWLIRPINFDNIGADALRINGHKLEEIKRYPEASKVIVEIENWLAEDGATTFQRSLLGQNVSFDKDMLEQLWKKCESKDSFPFGRRSLDTMCIELFLDFCKGQYAEGYSLSNLVKKYGVTNTKAHTAAADVLATKQVFEKQVEYFQKLIKGSDQV
jgi:DNA polymerase III alpha subunit (gram-positive type)